MKPKPPILRCATPYCRKKPQKGRTLCAGCRTREWRAKYPLKAAYKSHKDNAKRRKIKWDLSFEDFVDFCNENDFLSGKGRTRKAFSLDRIDEDPAIGYVKGNLQKLTVGENIIKSHQYRKRIKMLQYDWQTKTATVTDNYASNASPPPSAASGWPGAGLAADDPF